MSKNANPVTTPSPEPDADVVPESDDRTGSVAAPKKQIARLPWTSSSTDEVVMPWQMGADPVEPAPGSDNGSPGTSEAGVKGRTRKAATQASRGGSPFAVPAGPMPEDIPGFPYPDDPPEMAWESTPTPEDIPGFPLFSGGDETSGAPLSSGNERSVGPPTQGVIKPLTRLARPSAAELPRQEPNIPAQTQRETHDPGAISRPRPQVQVQTQSPALPHLQALPIHFPPMQSQAQAQPGISFRPNSAMLNSQSGNLSTDQLATGYLDPLEVMFHEPRSMQETGLNQGMIFDLVLKTMYYTSYMSGQEISAALRLPFYGIIDQIINLLKKEQLCEVSGAAGLGEAGYQYILTVKGMERAHQVMQRSKYVGPAPVPLAKYIEVMKLQAAKKPVLNRQTVENALQGFVISEDLVNQVGASVNAGKSLFLFGAPGNGKTLLTERIAKMLGGNVVIPYALEADGQIIQLFDLNSHHAAVPQGASESDTTKAELGDRRWIKIQKPVVVVGGELTMASLDLIYNDNVGFYEAPFQLKANGGLFLIDDFGRQQVSPQALLNRWIVPLEKGIDYLTLKTGKKLQVPFDLFLVLSTNLQPEDLIDEAFLRRIQNKLFVPDPTAQQFYEIFLGQCRMMNIPFDQNGFTHLVNKHYVEKKRPFRASQPRDLLRQLLGIARYRNTRPELTPELLDAACSTYFVKLKDK